MSSLSHWLVVINPSAGKRRSHERSRAVLEGLTLNGHSFDLVNSSDRAESIALLQAYLASEREYRGVLVVGGDGTMHTVADKVWRSGQQLPIAMVPNGTGNDFARQLGLHGKDVKVLIDRFISTQPVDIDVLVMGDRLALQVVSTGLDALVSQRARRMPVLLGKSRYVLALFLQIINLSSTRYRLTVNGEIFELEATLVAIANGQNYGGGMLISPNSVNDDQRFEIIVVGPVGRLRLLLLFPRIYSGSHIHHPLVTSYGGEQIHIEADTIAEADGEPLFDEPLNHSIDASQLTVWRM